MRLAALIYWVVVTLICAAFIGFEVVAVRLGDPVVALLSFACFVLFLRAAIALWRKP